MKKPKVRRKPKTTLGKRMPHSDIAQIVDEELEAHYALRKKHVKPTIEEFLDYISRQK